MTATIRMRRATPAHPCGPTTADVHPDSAADFLSAGWEADAAQAPAPRPRGRPRKSTAPSTAPTTDTDSDGDGLTDDTDPAPHDAAVPGIESAASTAPAVPPLTGG